MHHLPQGPGNDNAFGLIHRSGQGTPAQNGNSQGGELEHLCGPCHQQASPFAEP